MTISKTPLRISFAGGGTDLPEFYEKHRFGAVLSTAIDKYIRVSVSNRYDGKVLVYAGGTCELVDRVSDLKHNIIRECLRFAGAKNSVEVHVQADLPGSSGLGSSSALTVGLLRALGIHGDIASMAFAIERCVCGNPVGKQDHYIAASGGMYHFTFKDSGRVECEPFGAPHLSWLNHHLMLFDTGLRRSASLVLDDVAKNGAVNTDLLINMRTQVWQAIDIIRIHGDLGKLLHKGWDLKKATSEMVTTPEIDRLYAKALDAGATGGKICGAGGGGFLLLWVPPDRQEHIREAFLGIMFEVPISVGAVGSRIVYEDP